MKFSPNSLVQRVMALTSPNTSSLTYENAAYGIKILYPADWTKVEPTKLESGRVGAVSFESPIEQSNLQIHQETVKIGIDTLQKNYTLDEFADILIKGWREANINFKLLESNATTLAGNPAHKFVFTHQGHYAPQLEFKSMHIITLKYGKVYGVSFIAETERYPHFLPLAQKMIDSFVIEDTLTYESTTTTMNTKYGIKIQYPADWIKDEKRFPFAVVWLYLPVEVGSDIALADIGILVEEGQSSLKEFVNGHIMGVKATTKDFKIIESGSTTLSGLPAHIIVYTGMPTNYNQQLKFIDVLTVKDNNGYAVSYAIAPEKFAEFLPTAQKMFDSFVIAGSPASKKESPKPVPEIKADGERQNLVTVNMKLTKKSTLLKINNAADIAVYGVKIKATDGSIRFVKAKSWAREKIDASTVIVKTADKPILTGRSLFVILIVDNRATGVEWTAFDSSGSTIANGQAMPKS